VVLAGEPADVTDLGQDLRRGHRRQAGDLHQ
jgi:hypothetical protein